MLNTWKCDTLLLMWSHDLAAADEWKKIDWLSLMSKHFLFWEETINSY